MSGQPPWLPPAVLQVLADIRLARAQYDASERKGRGAAEHDVGLALTKAVEFAATLPLTTPHERAAAMVLMRVVEFESDRLDFDLGIAEISLGLDPWRFGS